MIDIERSRINWPLFFITAGFFTSFVVYSIYDLTGLGQHIDFIFNGSAQYFGFFWQILLVVNFLFVVAVLLHPGSQSKLGGEKQEFSIFQWGAMIMCTLLAGGGVFWAAAEPIAHLISPPPYFNMTAQSPDAAYAALAQCFMHWGFLAWAILGGLTTILLMHLHHDKGLPLMPSSLLYPILGEKAVRGPIANIANAISIIAAVAGTVGPIGFFGIQFSFALHELLPIPDSYSTQIYSVLVLMALYCASASTGLARGIQLLSKLNVFLTFALLAIMFLVGPSLKIINNFIYGYVLYIQDFFQMALYRGDVSVFGDPGWLSYWTIFFWGWFIGYAPLMSIFIARISRGRSIRQILTMVVFIAPILTNLWFSILGGTGVIFELETPGIISVPFTGFNLPAATLAITQHLPGGFYISCAFMLLTLIFVATTGDSMTYVVSSLISQSKSPTPALRIFWGIAIGVLTLILITIDKDSISKLQSFIVITAVPVSFLIMPAIFYVPYLVYRSKINSR